MKPLNCTIQGAIALAVMYAGAAGAQTPNGARPTLPVVRTTAAPVWRCAIDDALRPRHARDAAICDADFTAATLRASVATGRLTGLETSCALALAANVERSVGLIAIGDTAAARAAQATPCGARVVSRDSVTSDAASLAEECPGMVWSWAARGGRCLTLPIAPDNGMRITRPAASPVRPLSARARRDFAAGRYRRAIDDARAAAAADPLDDLAHAVAGGAQLLLGYPEYAVEELRLSLRSRPGDSWARERLADALLRSGRDSAAVAAADSALVVDGASPYAWRILGLARARLGQLDSAVAALGIASRLAPDDAAPHLALAQIFNSVHRWSDAEREARVAIEHRDDDHGRLLLATALAGEGDTAQARRELGRALQLAPWSHDARAMLDSLTAGRASP